MKLPSSVSKLLENKYVLYVVFFLAVTNVFGYMVMGNYKAIALFILVGYLVYNFNKNMIIVLAVPLILTSIFISAGVIREGNANMDEKSVIGGAESAVKAGANSTTHENTDAVVPKKKSEDKDKTDKKMPEIKDTKILPNTENQIDNTLTETGDDVPEGHTPDADSAMTTMYKKNNRIDYASTVEDAYGDLNKILGGDGIKRLTEDTQKLMGQQMQLADAMKSMTPLLTQAKTLLGSFDMKQFGNITAMAKQFGASE